MLASPAGTPAVRSRTSALLVAALSAALVSLAIAPARAGADRIRSNIGAPYADITLSGGTLTIKNTTTDFTILGVGGSVDSNVGFIGGATYSGGTCYVEDVADPNWFECDDMFSAAGLRPGRTMVIEIDFGDGYTGGLDQLNLITQGCLGGNRSVMRSARSAFAARLGECAREKLGKPVLLATRTNSSTAWLMLAGAPNGWATRVFGASSRGGVKTATSGKTVTRLKPRSSGYPRGVGTFNVPSSIKFVRAAWTKKGEKPILGSITPVM